jgi:hypothetical protein
LIIFDFSATLRPIPHRTPKPGRRLHATWCTWWRCIFARSCRAPSSADLALIDSACRVL